VPEGDRRNGRRGNRQEHTRNTSQSGASRHGDDDRQRMQGDAAPLFSSEQTRVCDSRTLKASDRGATFAAWQSK
jgi:hypothetical protein